MVAVKKLSGVALAAAAAGLLLSGAVFADEGAAGKTADANIKCAGINACKGQTACKSASNECKGKNSCKGKGFLAVSKEDCVAKKGTELKEEKKKEG
ncbi:MAG: hypothetical protein HY273_14005 [Gammaproteobacteria bacterium]|nr:hypothetical protein [Gammaproteobacteria bacterium]